MPVENLLSSAFLGPSKQVFYMYMQSVLMFGFFFFFFNLKIIALQCCVVFAVHQAPSMRTFSP